jgi:Ni/Fe-hydrogenase 1 B-type cytochrome subunit
MAAIPKQVRFPVYVWEVPVRLWHWVMVLSMAVLAVSGYFIGKPPATVPGEAIDNYVLGYIRFAHFTAGYIFAVALVGRIYWAIVGNRYAREIFVVPFLMLTPAWWGRLWRVGLEYAFIRHNPDVHIGHNALAMAAMFFMFVLGSVFMVATGFALYGEGTGAGSWAHTAFTSWLLPLFSNSQNLHTWHHLGMWYLLWFAMVHLYFVFREDLISGYTVARSMVDGYRARKD